jgi:hypothetical protein
VTRIALVLSLPDRPATHTPRGFPRRARGGSHGRRWVLAALINVSLPKLTTVQRCLMVWVKVGPNLAPYTNGTMASEGHDCQLRSRLVASLLEK